MGRINSKKMKKLINFTFNITAALLIVILCGYVFLCNYAFREMFLVDGNKDECEQKAGGNTLTSYKTHVRRCEDWEHFDMSAYFVEQDSLAVLEEFYFHAADGFGPLHGWFLPAMGKNENPESVPTVVVVHGFRVCKHHFSTLIVSAMLHRNNYNVMLLDLRNHGKSAKQHPTPYATFGSAEHHDVLGAINYLKQKFGDDHLVGLYGSSMGAATVMIAAARDKRINAIYLDSPPCKIYELMHRNVLEMFLHLPYIGDHIPRSAGTYFVHAVMQGVCAIAKIRVGGEYGCPPFNHEPAIELTKMNGTDKAFHFDHAKLDTLVPYEHTLQCSAIIKNQKHKHVSVNIADRVGKVAPKWNTSCKDHVVMSLMNISEKEYETRVVNFFNKYLIPSE